MKPIRSTIPIRELQTLLRQWRRRGLREAALLKVLELYLGLPDYMNAKGEYPVHFFYELSRTLKFHTVTIKDCPCFDVEAEYAMLLDDG